MGQLIGVSIGGPYVGIIIAVAVVGIAATVRRYMMRIDSMHPKCQKCHNVFDASCSLSGLHFGPYKQLKCPSCGKISLMNTYAKDPITWPLEEKTQQQTELQLTERELEQKRIEDSKYERS